MSQLFILLFITILQAPTISEIRLQYVKATSNEQACKDLISRLEPYTAENNPLFFGYRAGATMIMASHAFNPVTKLLHFKNGRTMLESAIQADEKNVELRFLRFGVQTNAPEFLGYKSEINNDKKFILEALPDLDDKQLKHIIIAYLKESEALTDSEKKLLE